MNKPAINLDEVYEDVTDFELQRRNINLRADGNVNVIYYVWLSDKRKEELRQNKAWGWQYRPFEDGDKVSETICGMKLSGKIMSVDTTYYDGDCHVLYVTLDKRSAKKYLEKKSNG